MNRKFLGDSYDVVKRYFVEQLRKLGYRVLVDPRSRGDWGDEEELFLKFLNVERVGGAIDEYAETTALFIDPDTGVSEKSGAAHASYSELGAACSRHALVFAFDQSFSRGGDKLSKMHEKMKSMNNVGCHAMYYSSHAAFLFVSRDSARLHALKLALLESGLPEGRLVSEAGGFRAMSRAD